MRRAVAAAVAVCLVAALAWTISSRERVEKRAARLTTQFEGPEDHVERLLSRARTAERRLEAEHRENRRLRHRHENLREELLDARSSLQELRTLGEAVLPGRRGLSSVHVVRSTNGSRLLTATWDRGLQIWRLTPRSGTRTVESVAWELVHEVVTDLESMSISIQTPAGETRERSEIAYWSAGIVALHDLTGDGLRDFVLGAYGSGTAGCGTVWVLENADPPQEIFERVGCESNVEPRKGLLVLDQSLHPKGCPSIHGCGSKTTWLRWDGASWETVKTRRRG